jgi:hypothetical protein
MLYGDINSFYIVASDTEFFRQISPSYKTFKIRFEEKQMNRRTGRSLHTLVQNKANRVSYGNMENICNSSTAGHVLFTVKLECKTVFDVHLRTQHFTQCHNCHSNSVLCRWEIAYYGTLRCLETVKEPVHTATVHHVTIPNEINTRLSEVKQPH